MALTAECPFCAVLIKNLPEDTQEQGVQCPRCLNFFAMPDQPGVKESKPAKPSSQEKKRPKAGDPAPAPKAPAKQQIVHPTGEAKKEAPTARAFSVWGVAALMIGSLAFMLVTLPNLTIVAAGLSALGLAIGVVGIKSKGSEDGLTLFPIIGACVSLAALLFSGVYWSMQRSTVEEPPAPRFDPGQSVAIKPAARQNPVGGTSFNPVGDSSWSLAGADTLQQGNIRIRITSAYVQTVEVPQSKAKGSAKAKKPLPDKALFIHVQMANMGFEGAGEYKGWSTALSSADAVAPTLRDSLGKGLKIKVLPAEVEVPGQTAKATLFPGKTIEDVLVFEPSTPKAEYLRLELPAAAFGGTGSLKWQIPTTFIQFR